MAMVFEPSPLLIVFCFTCNLQSKGGYSKNVDFTGFLGMSIFSSDIKSDVKQLIKHYQNTRNTKSLFLHP